MTNTLAQFLARAASGAYGTIFLDFADPSDLDKLDATMVGGSPPVDVNDAAGGTVTFTNGATEDDYATITFNAEVLNLNQLDKRFYAIGRFKPSEATQSDMFFGIGVRDSDPLGGITDAVALTKVDETTGISTLVAKDSATTHSSANQATLAAAFTEWALAIRTDPNTAGKFYVSYIVDDVVVEQYVVEAANSPYEELMTLVLQHQNGSANARNIEIDYLGIQWEL